MKKNILKESIKNSLRINLREYIEERNNIESIKVMLNSLPNQIDELVESARTSVDYALRLMGAVNDFSDKFSAIINGVDKVDYDMGDVRVMFSTSLTAQSEDWVNDDSQLNALASKVNSYAYSGDGSNAVSAYFDDNEDGSINLELNIKIFDRDRMDDSLKYILNAANENLDLL